MGLVWIPLNFQEEAEEFQSLCHYLLLCHGMHVKLGPVDLRRSLPPDLTPSYALLSDWCPHLAEV